MEELEQPSIFSLQPVTTALQFVAAYGWWLVAGAAVALYAASALQPRLQRWRQQREDAAYHKDPDVELRRMEAIQRAREKQQEMLAAASALQAEKQKEREERKRMEAMQRVGAAGASGSVASGSRLGTREDYLPLSGGGGAPGGYRPPKKSKCGGGGCGR